MVNIDSISVLGKKVAFSTIVQIIGKGAQIILATLTLKLISGFLSQNEMGTFAAISEVALFFSVVANLGIFGNVIRRLAHDPTDGQLFINALVLRIISAIVLFSIGFFILITISSDRVFLIGSALFLSALFFDFISAVCDAALQALYRMGRAMLALILGRVMQFGLVYYFISHIDISSSVAIPYLYLITLLGSLVTALLSVIFVRKFIKWQWQIDWSMMVNILRGSILFGLINITNNLYFRFAPDYFASVVLSKEQFGSFSLQFRIIQVLSLFSTLLMFSVLPILKQAINKYDLPGAKKIFKASLIILLTVGILVIIGGTITSNLLIGALTHKKYILPELWFAFPMLLILAAVSYGYDLILLTLFALEKDKWLLSRELIALIVGFTFFFGAMQLNVFQAQIFTIILGAILAEGTIVALGARKAWQLLDKKNPDKSGF